MKTTIVTLALALAMASPALAATFPAPLPDPLPTIDDWSDYPRQRLHCGNKKCRERLRFLQSIFPGATSFPRSCRIGLSITPTDQRYVAENLFLVCPKHGLVIEDGANQHDD